jgi:hypothetical protein
MKQLIPLSVVMLLVAITMSPLPVAARAPTHIDGGGTAVGSDTSSQFGMGVTVAGDGSVSGHFNCVMAGRSAMPGLSDMTVRGPVTYASLSVTPGKATFGGVGTLNMKFAQGGARETMTVDYSVTVTTGGAGVGTLALAVPAASFSMSETVTSGHISIH